MFEFYSADYRRTLFPMSTNRYLIENGQDEIAEFLSRCLDPDQEAFSFRSQTRVYAGKPGFHLRRTVKLDPVAEYFIYDLVLQLGRYANIGIGIYMAVFEGSSGHILRRTRSLKFLRAEKRSLEAIFCGFSPCV
ncbi:MAG: hypothetical protein COB29_14010 [Sulfitobacter sp.]|nr:MAG: hypothetical protein COB29_14010 [Sulfitobacter sp.]